MSPGLWIPLLAALHLAGASAASLTPGVCVRQVRRARIEGLAGRHDEALARLRKAVAACPDALVPRATLIDAHRRYGLPDAAREAHLVRLEERLADADLPLPATEIGVLATWPGVGEDILRRISAVLVPRVAAMAAPGPAMLEALARLQRRLGEDSAAAAALERLALSRPGDQLAWRLVKLYRRLDRPADEARWLRGLAERADAWRPDYVRALARAGQVEEMRRQLDAMSTAEAAPPREPGLVLTPGPGFRPTVELDRDALEAWLSLHSRARDSVGLRVESAWILRDLGLDAAAEALFREALALAHDKDHLQSILLNLYGTEADRQRYAEAEAHRWQQVTDPQALFDEGTHLLTTGDARAAIDLLRRAAPQLADLEPAWFNLGMAGYRLEDWETVESAFGRAAELNPDRAAAFYFRGIALVHLERWAEALPVLARALELDPDRVLAHYYLSKSLEVLGDETAAAEQMKLYQARSEP